MLELSRSKKTRLPDAPNGRRRYAINASIDVLQMKEDGGEWEDIDSTLDEEGLPARVPYDLTPYLNGLPGFHFKSKQSGEFDVRLKEARQDSISITPISPKPSVKPIIEGRTITWVDLYPDVDVVLTAFNTGVMLNRIIKSAYAPLEYDVAVTEIKKGVAQLMPLKPATDADGQLIKMEEKPTLDGRTETLTLEVLPFEDEKANPIKYPIKDSTVVDEFVGASEDDAYEYDYTKIVDVTSIGIIQSSNPLTRMWGGYRFVSGDFPSQGSMIDVAYLRLYFYLTSKDDVNVNIHFEDGASPIAFTTSDNDITLRTRTTNSTSWIADSVAAGGTGWYNSPSLCGVGSPAQELFDSYSPSAIVAITRGNTDVSKTFYVHSWDYNDHSHAPELYIEYTEGGGAILTNYYRMGANK